MILNIQDNLQYNKYRLARIWRTRALAATTILIKYSGSWFMHIIIIMCTLDEAGVAVARNYIPGTVYAREPHPPKKRGTPIIVMSLVFNASA